MALEALWIIAQFCSDVLLETDFLRSQIELQRDVVVTAVSFLMGGVFYWYLVRFGSVGTTVQTSSREET